MSTTCMWQDPYQWCTELTNFTYIKPYPLIFKALIHGANCYSISIVPLLLDHGVSFMILLDDLGTNWWLKGGPYGGWMGNNFADLSAYRTTFTHFPLIANLELMFICWWTQPEQWWEGSFLSSPSMQAQVGLPGPADEQQLSPRQKILLWLTGLHWMKYRRPLSMILSNLVNST